MAVWWIIVMFGLVLVGGEGCGVGGWFRLLCRRSFSGSVCWYRRKSPINPSFFSPRQRVLVLFRMFCRFRRPLKHPWTGVCQPFRRLCLWNVMLLADLICSAILTLFSFSDVNWGKSRLFCCSHSGYSVLLRTLHIKFAIITWIAWYHFVYLCKKHYLCEGSHPLFVLSAYLYGNRNRI